MKMIEIYKLKPKPKRVAAVGERLFKMYLEAKKNELKNDLATDWFGRWLARLLTYTALDGVESISVKRYDGTSITIYVKNRASGYNVFANTENSEVGSYIGIGTSNTPPSKQDNALLGEVTRQKATASYVDGTDVVSVSASFSLASDTDIWEVGLYYKMYTGAGQLVLLDRTVLSAPVTFPANTPMSVVYKFAI